MEKRRRIKIGTTRPTKILNSYNIHEIISNPIYTGLGGFPEVISDLQWIKANKIAIEIEGKHQFLINLSSTLERSFNTQLKGEEEWIKKVEKILEGYDIQKVLVNLLDFLKNFFKKEGINKDIGKSYKKWLITLPIPIVILQIINNLRIILYIKIFKSSNFELVIALIWLFKSSKSGFLNPPILEIKSFFLHVKSG